MLPHPCRKNRIFSSHRLSSTTMRPRNKAPSKSTVAASPAASPGSAWRSTRLASSVVASPAASPGSAQTSTRLASRLYGTEQLPSVSTLASTTSREGDTTLNEALFHDISVAAKNKKLSCKHTIGRGGRVAFWFMQLWCHSGNGCTLPAYGGSIKECKTRQIWQKQHNAGMVDDDYTQASVSAGCQCWREYGHWLAYNQRRARQQPPPLPVHGGSK